MLEFRKVNEKEAMSKEEQIREISRVTKINQYIIEDVLRAFVAIATREQIVKGAWKYPGLPVVTRHIKKKTTRLDPNTKEKKDYPETCYLKAKIPPALKKRHREAFRNQNNINNGTTRENWYKKDINKE